MKQYFLRKISELRMFRMLQNAPAPRWLIFTIDMFIVAMVSLTIFLFHPFELNTATEFYSYCLFIIMYAIMNLATGTYKCIVRFSMPYDLYKAFCCVLLASAGICVVSLGYALFTPRNTPLIGIFPIIFIGTMVLSLMMSLRIVIKYMFININKAVAGRERVIVLGTAINSLSLAMTLRNEVNGQFMPVAMLALGSNHASGSIQGMPVEEFSENKLEEIFERHEARTLVFLQTQTPLMRGGLAEHFMNAHINLRVLNQIDEFDVDSENKSPNISAHVNAVKIEDLLDRQVIKTDSRRVQKALEGSTVLITGAAGSIGSEIVRQVAAFNADCIILLDQAETPMHDMQLEMEKSYPDTKIVLYVADVQNRKRLEKTFQTYKPQYVFHAAAYKHVPMMERNPSEAILTNVMGTKNLADLSLQYNVRKFVMVSTDKAVNPTNIMGASKRIAEIYVQSLFFHALENASRDGDLAPQFITTRFGNVLGSNGSVIPLFRRQIEAGGPVTVTHKDIIRYFMTIKEACSLVLEAGCMGHGGEIFLFDMGKPVKIYDLARRMIQLAGYKPNVDINIVETGLRPGEKLYEELLNDKEKTVPTDNDKIMIAKVRKYDFTSILPHIKTLIKLASDGNIHDMVLTMKELVPEYISNNSVFESIDRELHHNDDAHKNAPAFLHPPQIDYNSMNIKHLTALLCLLLTTLSTQSRDLRELLGKVGEVINNTENSLPSLGDMAEGLLNGSDINLKELKGQWIVEGSAVSFRSDNLLQNVGGSAAASLIENKLDPYFEKYGLTGSILTIDADGKFALKIKGLTLTGKITKQKTSKGEEAQKGNFIFTFDNAGALAAGNVTTFVTRRTNGLNIMFDATKLQDIMNAISSYANTSTAKAVSQLLNQYDGICVGFSLGRSRESAKQS